MTEIKLEFDSTTVCRICLQSSDEEMISIYQRDSGDNPMSLCEKIEKCSGIKIITSPELPSQICTKCNAFLNLAYKFRKICRHSDTYLREFVYPTATATAASKIVKTPDIAPDIVKDVTSNYEIDEENVFYLDDSYQDECTVSSESAAVMLTHESQQQHIQDEIITNDCDEVEYEELQDYSEGNQWNNNDTNDDADSEQFIIEDMNTDESNSNTWAMHDSPPPHETTFPLQRIATQQTTTKPTTISSRRIKLTALAAPQVINAAAKRNNNNKTVKLPTLPTLSTTTRRKTLGISSDGAAVIRERSERISSLNTNQSSRSQLHICQICGNSYARKYALLAHMRHHNNEKPYEYE